eukprot:GHVL01019791.1.p2 GENE.GHVL01019791.1~~GHVL01019791.1.p2  ORF type:complete len:368 (-),score=104.11 GHVL01019791.1:97-1200(-)
MSTNDEAQKEILKISETVPPFDATQLTFCLDNPTLVNLRINARFLLDEHYQNVVFDELSKVPVPFLLSPGGKTAENKAGDTIVSVIVRFHTLDIESPQHVFETVFRKIKKPLSSETFQDLKKELIQMKVHFTQKLVPPDYTMARLMDLALSKIDDEILPSGVTQERFLSVMVGRVSSRRHHVKYLSQLEENSSKLFYQKSVYEETIKKRENEIKKNLRGFMKIEKYILEKAQQNKINLYFSTSNKKKKEPISDLPEGCLLSPVKTTPIAKLMKMQVVTDVHVSLKPLIKGTTVQFEGVDGGWSIFVCYGDKKQMRNLSKFEIHGAELTELKRAPPGTEKEFGDDGFIRFDCLNLSRYLNDVASGVSK